MKDKSISYARKRIEKQIEFQEQERKRRLQATRLELARAGMAAYKKRKLSEAVNKFRAYIKILEEIKEVGEGGLLPSHFDLKKEQPELLMISGVYWDLAKLYDRTRSPDKYNEFRHYIQKYIAFSNKMPYQHLCAEAVRKYLTGGGPVHREEFRQAYKVLGVNQCFVATAVSDELVPFALPTLRKFRDEFLDRYSLGRKFIDTYYAVSPRIASKVAARPRWQRRLVAGPINGFVLCLKLFGFKSV